MASSLQPGTVFNRGHRCFFDGDQHVAMGAAARQLQIGNIDPAKNAERGDAAARVVFVLLGQRLAALQLHLASDRFRLRPRVADNQDVIDEYLRPFMNDEMQIDVRPVGSGPRVGQHGHFRIAPIEVELGQVVRIRRNLRLHVRLPGPGRHDRAKHVGADLGVAVERHRLH
jgi:hypothetical protein